MTDLASYFDHTILSPTTTGRDVERLCTEAGEFGFASVCIPPYFVRYAAKLLEKSPVRVTTVIGFPMGYAATAAKVEEIKRAADEGVDELDAVINLCAVKAADWKLVQHDLDRLITGAHLRGKLVKLILETALLSPAELQRLIAISNELEPDFVKTSTGFNGGGASLEVVQRLRELCKPSIRIKASGGIRSRAAAEAFVAAGAGRLGSSSSVQIIREL